ncbi:MAG: dicarboxylate/amino acid:cation symporter, partial [Planctomycetales bacterium]
MSTIDPIPETAEPSARRKLGLTAKILICLFAGVACGLFFGEGCSFFATIGDGFVGLLQMTVLPYITVALITNVGRLSSSSSRQFAITAIVSLLFFWLLAIIGLIIMPMSFPDLDKASYYSSGILKAPQSVDFLHLFIPSNPFNSLANSVIPAVVVFCLCMGAAIIGMKNKAVVLDHLDFLAQALSRVNSYVVKLTPYGIFAIAAGAAGTMTLDQFGRLQAYLIVYSVAVAIMSFWLLPMLVAVCTPFSYGDVMRASRDAMITAFVTAKLFVVLPLLIEQSKHLFHRHHLQTRESDAETEALIPLAYPFPNAGKLLSLLFIPFTAWFVGTPMA